MSFQIAIFKFVAGRTIACSQQDPSLAKKAANLFAQFGSSTILPQGEPCQPCWQCAGRVIPLIPTCSFSVFLQWIRRRFFWTAQYFFEFIGQILTETMMSQKMAMSTKRFKYDKNVFWLDEGKSSLMNDFNLPRYWNDCINLFGLRNLRVFPPLGPWSTIR